MARNNRDLSRYTPEILAVGCDRCGMPNLRRCKNPSGQECAPHEIRILKVAETARIAEAEIRGKIAAYQDIWKLMTDAYGAAEPYSDLRALASAITGVNDRLRLLQDGKGGESFGEVFGDRSREPSA